MGRPFRPAEVVERLPAPDFADVPVLIREHGRSRGFERLRDIVLNQPEAVSADNLMGVLKLVIELDRHALFAQVHESKANESTSKAWDKFQQYLQGEPEDEAPKAKPKKGVKRGRKTEPEVGSPSGEVPSLIRELQGSDPSGTGYQGPEGSGG